MLRWSVLALSLIIASSGLAFAPTKASAASAAEACGTLGEIGGTIMESRQKGVPLNALIEIIRNSGAGELTDLYLEIVRLAYQAPIAPSDDVKAAYIRAFRGAVERSCLQSL